jgi:hypothetical protein
MTTNIGMFIVAAAIAAALDDFDLVSPTVSRADKKELMKARAALDHECPGHSESQNECGMKQCFGVSSGISYLRRLDYLVFARSSIMKLMP